MINPTRADIGRRVIYTAIGKAPEYGEITSFNDGYVFVRYDNKGDTSQPTSREALTWAGKS